MCTRIFCLSTILSNDQLSCDWLLKKLVCQVVRPRSRYYVTVKMKINYTAFFVALLAIGTIVFIGIVGAAWMSALDNYDPARPTNPVHITVKPDTTTDEIYFSDATSSRTSVEYNFSSSIKTLSSVLETDSTLKEVESTSEKETYSRTPSFSSDEPLLVNNDIHATEISRSFLRLDDGEIECERIVLEDEKGDIIPNYDNINSCREWIVQYEEGYNVDITIRKLDLDRTTNDFLLLSSGPNITNDEGNPIFTGSLNETKQYRIPKTGSAYILFVTHESNNSLHMKPDGFNIRYHRQGELTTPPPSTTPPSVPQPPDNNNDTITVTILCNKCKMIEYENGSYTIIMAPIIEENFKTAIAIETNLFCKREKIMLQDIVIKENVFITSKWPCVQTWPERDKCVHMKMAIAVNHTESHYELTRNNLQKLWNEWDGKQLEEYNIQILRAPPFKTHTLVWTLSLVAFFVALSVAVFYAWQGYLNCTYKRNDKEELSEPSSSLDVPPIFGDLDDQMDDPEYLPAYARYSVGTETSTDDLTISYDKLPYNESPYNTLTFATRRIMPTGVDNKVFFPEEEEEEYEIMSRSKIVNEFDKSQA